MHSTSGGMIRCVAENREGAELAGSGRVNSEADCLYRLINHSDCLGEGGVFFFLLSSRFFGPIVICSKQRTKDVE